VPAGARVRFARRARRDRAEGRRAGDHEDQNTLEVEGFREASLIAETLALLIPREHEGNEHGKSQPGFVDRRKMSEAASRNTLALNPLVGIRGQDLVDSAGTLFKAIVNEPKVAAEQWFSFLGELGSIVAGKSERAPQAGDRRFSDAT